MCVYIYTFIYLHRIGYRRTRTAKCESLLGVNANNFGQLICYIFGSLRISLAILQIAFANGFANRHFLSLILFIEKFYTIRSNSVNILRIANLINLKMDSQFFDK